MIRLGSRWYSFRHFSYTDSHLSSRRTAIRSLSSLPPLQRKAHSLLRVRRWVTFAVGTRIIDLQHTSKVIDFIRSSVNQFPNNTLCLPPAKLRFSRLLGSSVQLTILLKINVRSHGKPISGRHTILMKRETIGSIWPRSMVYSLMA